ncbi:MAG: hypothetical protein ACK4NV_15165 [Pannonibacter sp.]
MKSLDHKLLAMMCAYRLIADRMLGELVDRTPRTINFLTVRDELLAEMRQTVVDQGASYEEEALIVTTALRTIEDFFAGIKVEGPGDDL